MFAKLIDILGFEIVYVHDWGEYKSKYSAADWASYRPIHPGMSVAPPSARIKLRRKNG